MKKIISIFFVVFILTSCGISQEEINHRRSLEIEREKQRTLQLQAKIDEEAKKTPEQKKAESEQARINSELELQKKQAESLQYLENSRKVHDTVEAIGV